MARPARADPRAGSGPERVRWHIEILGLVQGVGFRPWLYRQAIALGLAGQAANTAGGLVVELEGPASTVADFVAALPSAAPARARVDAVRTEPVAALGECTFRIIGSSDAGDSTGVLADLATCDACLAEVLDPGNRRYRYPFTSCVDCGPRYSILTAPPYDRSRTAMAGFTLCDDCQAEYGNPADRRFHAEANACPRCGPSLRWQSGSLCMPDAAGLAAAVAALRAGAIVALKGLGGFQLLVDARNDEAVARLRTRKQRPEKPLALLVADLAAARRLCVVTADEAALLAGPAAPIVLLHRRPEAGVAAGVAPGCPLLGLMLPATPLHHLLARDAGFPLVATSGNLAGEPLLYDDDAPGRLAQVADGCLLHDRPILHPVDDSVVRMAAGRPLLLRRARGYAPLSLPVPGMPAGLVGNGAHLKNAVAVSTAGTVLIGPHVGDLESAATRVAHHRSLRHLHGLAGHPPLRATVRDLHPDVAAGDAVAATAPELRVQHHLAHVLACAAEAGWQGPVLGVAWDGAGFGPDGTLWGGEFLAVAGHHCRRVAHFRPFRLPGGTAALRQPWRAALGALHVALDGAEPDAGELPCLGCLPPGDVAIIRQALRHGLNAPVTTSVGRLFDAVAALLDLRTGDSYEGQAAAMVEWAAGHEPATAAYDFPLRAAAVPGEPQVLDFAPALRQMLADRTAGLDVASIAARWHEGLARTVLAVARTSGLRRVALAGGCFQNRRLLERTVALLGDAGYDVAWPRQLPPNDGGLALGQVVAAAGMLAESA